MSMKHSAPDVESLLEPLVNRGLMVQDQKSYLSLAFPWAFIAERKCVEEFLRCPGTNGTRRQRRDHPHDS